MVRIRWQWISAVVALAAAAALGTHAYLSSKQAACLALLPRCEEAQRIAARLCSVRLPGACRARDDAYGVEFQAAEIRYRACGDSEAYSCTNAQRFRDEPGRREGAEAAARLCAEGRAYACVMLGLDHRDGLGMPVDRMKAAKAFEEACELGATFHCRRAESLYLEQLIRRAYATQLPDAKAYAERGIADVQSFYVLEARLSEAKPQAGDMERELERQQGQMYDPNSIVPGSSVVLSVRTFYTGRAGWTDDSSFEKISVELPSLHEDVVVDVAAPNVRFYYASGSSSWSPTAGDRFALHATGTVRISSVDERTGIVGAQLDLTFRPRDIKCSGLEGESEPKTIHEARWFARKSREQLSAWQGGSRRNLRNFP